MTGRLPGLPLALVIAAGGAALADEPRHVPAVGAALTYRMTVATKIQRTITSGQIYTYVVTAADATTATASIRPVAMIYGCAPPEAAMTDCPVAAKTEGAKQEGDLVVVPVPGDLADNLARQGSLKLRLFVVEQREAAVPGLQKPEGDTAAGFGREAAYLQVNALHCEPAALQGFLPFGSNRSISLSCKQVSARRPGPGSTSKGFERTEDVTVEFTDNGAGTVTTPAGQWDIHKIGVKETPSDAKSPTTTGEFAFSERLGVAVKWHSRTANPSRPNEFVIDAEGELIAVN